MYDLKKLYKLDLWEMLIPDSNDIYIRVPWWWVYKSPQWVCFIPYNGEFK